MTDIERRIEHLEALLLGPGGEVQEEAEMRERVYDRFRRHKTEGAPAPELGDAEREHWDRLEVYHRVALRVAAGPA